MKIRTKMAAAIAIGATITFANAARAGDVVIDDFKTGAFETTLSVNGARETIREAQPTDGLGRARVIRYLVNPSSKNPNPQGRIQVAGAAQKLIVSNDYGSPHRTELKYGVDIHGNNAPLNHDLSNLEKMTLTFESMDLGLNINIVLFGDSGRTRVASAQNVNRYNNHIVGFPGREVQVEFTRDSFAKQPSLPDFTWDDVDYIVAIIQTGNAMHAGDYALTEFSYTE